MKFGICNEIFKDWEIEKSLQFAKDTGYDAIEIAPFTLANYVTDITPETRKRIRDYAAKIELDISAVHWVLVQAEGMYMTHTDQTIRAKTAQYFCDLSISVVILEGNLLSSAHRNSATCFPVFASNRPGIGQKTSSSPPSLEQQNEML